MTNPMQQATTVKLSDLSVPPFQRGPKGFAEQIATNFDPFLADPLKVGKITDLKAQPMWVLDGCQRFTALTLMASDDPTIDEANAFVQDMTKKEAYDYCLKANTERIKFEFFDQFPVLVAKGDKTARIMIAAAKDADVTFLMREATAERPLVRSVSSAASWVSNALAWADGESELVTNGLQFGLTLLKAWREEQARKGFPPAWTIEGAATLGLFYDGEVDPAVIGKGLPAWTTMKAVSGKGYEERYENRARLIAETYNSSHKGTFPKPKATIAMSSQS